MNNLDVNLRIEMQPIVDEATKITQKHMIKEIRQNFLNNISCELQNEAEKEAKKQVKKSIDENEKYIAEEINKRTDSDYIKNMIVDSMEDYIKNHLHETAKVILTRNAVHQKYKDILVSKIDQIADINKLFDKEFKEQIETVNKKMVKDFINTQYERFYKIQLNEAINKRFYKIQLNKAIINENL